MQSGSFAGCRDVMAVVIDIGLIGFVAMDFNLFLSDFVS
jgi:hypothetical protein